MKTTTLKRIILFPLIAVILTFSNCNAGNPGNKSDNSKSGGLIVQLTNDSFKKLIFDYEANKDWKYLGTRPAIIDFYADWCAPCRQMSPLVEELAKQYEGKINVYKVNTDKEQLLTQSVGVSSLPTLLFIPPNGKPQITVGAIPKETLQKVVNDLLLTK